MVSNAFDKSKNTHNALFLLSLLLCTLQHLLLLCTYLLFIIIIVHSYLKVHTMHSYYLFHSDFLFRPAFLVIQPTRLKWSRAATGLTNTKNRIDLEPKLARLKK